MEIQQKHVCVWVKSCGLLADLDLSYMATVQTPSGDLQQTGGKAKEYEGYSFQIMSSFSGSSYIGYGLICRCSSSSQEQTVDVWEVFKACMCSCAALWFRRKPKNKKGRNHGMPHMWAHKHAEPHVKRWAPRINMCVYGSCKHANHMKRKKITFRVKLRAGGCSRSHPHTPGNDWLKPRPRSGGRIWKQCLCLETTLAHKRIFGTFSSHTRTPKWFKSS